MLIEPTMGGAPCIRLRLHQALAKPFAHQRMGVERVGRPGVLWRQTPHLTQAGDGAGPSPFVKTADRISDPRDYWLLAKRAEAIDVGGPVEQADNVHDVLRHWLVG